MISYEQQLDANIGWALREGSMHFENESAVHKTLRRITRRLEEIGVPYAVVGGMAMFLHGYRRFTEVVDLLVTPEGQGQRTLSSCTGKDFGQELVAPIRRLHLSADAILEGMLL